MESFQLFVFVHDTIVIALKMNPGAAQTHAVDGATAARFILFSA